MSERERSPLYCAAPNRKGRPCSKLGHHLSEDGRRWCRSHLPADAERSPVRCEGRRADDSQCVTMAEQLLPVEGTDTPLCHFHAQLLAQEGVVQPERKRGRRNGSVQTDGLDLDGLGLDLDDDAVAGTIRQRLLDTAHDLFPAASDVLSDALKAERAEMVTCPHCKRRHRRVVTDMATRLTALKILLDRSVAAPSSSGSEPEHAPLGADVTRLSTAELRRIAHGQRDD